MLDGFVAFFTFFSEDDDELLSPPLFNASLYNLEEFLVLKEDSFVEARYALTAEEYDCRRTRYVKAIETGTRLLKKRAIIVVSDSLYPKKKGCARSKG
jgi:hypothetical protein